MGCGGSPDHTEAAPAVGTAPSASQTALAPAGDAVQEPDLSATTAGPAAASCRCPYSPSASSGDSSPPGGQFLDADTGPTAPTEGPSLAASAQGAEYTWQDGPPRAACGLQLDLVAQPTSENRDDDVVAVDQGELSIVRRQERHEEGAGEPVLPDRVRAAGDVPRQSSEVRLREARVPASRAPSDGDPSGAEQAVVLIVAADPDPS